MTEGFELYIPGKPHPAARHRHVQANGKTRTYPGKGDAVAKGMIQMVWMKAGRPRVTGPYTVEIVAVFPRPKTHLNQSGLSAAGRRAGPPQADLDNLAKTVLDALMEVDATDDDRWCVRLNVAKYWSDNENGGTAVVVLPAPEIPDLVTRAIAPTS